MFLCPYMERNIIKIDKVINNFNSNVEMFYFFSLVNILIQIYPSRTENDITQLKGLNAFTSF